MLYSGNNFHINIARVKDLFIISTSQSFLRMSFQLMHLSVESQIRAFIKKAFDKLQIFCNIRVVTSLISH